MDGCVAGVAEGDEVFRVVGAAVFAVLDVMDVEIAVAAAAAALVVVAMEDLLAEFGGDLVVVAVFDRE